MSDLTVGELKNLLKGVSKDTVVMDSEGKVFNSLVHHSFYKEHGKPTELGPVDKFKSIAVVLSRKPEKPTVKKLTK